MENHHEPLNDCKNTFKCFKKMIKKDYNFQDQEIKFSENIFDDCLKEGINCRICDCKILIDTIAFQFKNNIELDKKIMIKDTEYSLIVPDNVKEKLKDQDEKIICKKCLTNFELITKTNIGEMINIVKLRPDDYYRKQFFFTIGDERTTVYIESSYKEKEEIKKLGGRWDSEKKLWFYTYTSKNSEKMINKFSKWVSVNS